MTPPLDIVILNDHASLTGGSAAVALASARGLAARSVSVTLLTCVGPVAPELRTVPNLEVICLEQEEIAKASSRLGAFASGLRNSRAVEAVRSVLRSKRRDRTVIHVHSWTKAFSPFALDAVCEMGFPLVMTLHDYFITCPSGGFYDHGANELCQRTPLSLGCITCNCDRRHYAHKLWRTARTAIQNRILHVPRRIAHYVGVSHFSLNVLRPHLPAGVPVTMVRNPLESVDGGPASPSQNRNFLFIGRFEEEKGVRLFAEAIRATGLPAVFIGDGSLAPELKRLCPSAQFTGWLGAGQIRAHLAAARALVFPPLWYETLGLVVVEAVAAGVPALVSDRCAATDVVQDGVNGLHFAHGDLGSLSEKMRLLADDSALAGRLGRQGYAGYWADPWTVDRHVEELLGVYRKLTRTAA
jgi:glycosyltransferase involved in cell wall biosynthesis